MCTTASLDMVSVVPKFTGKERDAETGLDFFGARYMSSAQGRFTSPDSKQSSAKLDNPQSWNRYSYTDNNPLAFVDPDGREKLRVTLTTYIPGRTITDPFGRIYNANGNGRGSTPFDYKTRQTATVETDRRISPSGKIGEPTGVVGITQRFDKSGKEIGRAKEADNAVQQTVGRKEDGSVGISFSGAATNPLGLPGTPSIDFNISITCTGGSCSATGAHDGFPGYRIEITNEAGKTTEIYTYDPNKAGKTPTALFPPMDCQVPRSEGCAAGQGPKQ